MELQKANEEDPVSNARATFDQMLEDESFTISKAFRNFIQTVQDDLSDEEILRFIEEKDLKGFLKYIGDYVDEFADELPKSFVRAAKAEIDRLSEPGTFGLGKLKVDFDPGTKSAAQLMEDSRLGFIKDFTETQRSATRTAIADSLREGKGPAAAARNFREAIGLTEKQAQAVRNYQSLLERGSSQALDRQLRDARFDRTVARVIEDNDVLSGKQIERMVGRYAENMRNYRAMTIARTETMRTLNAAKQESWAQIVDQLGIDPDDGVDRIWVATLDNRVRDTHRDMHMQTVEGLETPFESPSGEELMYPGDPTASAEEVINCLLPGNFVDSPDLLATVRGYYDGQAVTIKSTGGRDLSVTFYHPVLTLSGWKPAGLLNEADYLVTYCRADRSWSCSTSSVDANYVPSRIEDIHESGLVFGAEVPRSMNFHGDIVNRDIEVKLQAGSLLLCSKTRPLQKFSQASFTSSNVVPSDRFCLCPSNLGDQAILLATPRSVGNFHSDLSLLLSHLGPFDEFCLTLGSWPHSVFKQDAVDGSALRTKELRERLNRAPSLVAFDKVASIRTYPFRGHVYSPQTVSGMYVANDILQHNCRCTMVVKFRLPAK